MGLDRAWVVAVMAVGAVAAVVAGGLFWLVLTQPVTAASLVGRGL